MQQTTWGLKLFSIGKDPFQPKRHEDKHDKNAKSETYKKKRADRNKITIITKTKLNQKLKDQNIKNTKIYHDKIIFQDKSMISDPHIVYQSSEKNDDFKDLSNFPNVSFFGFSSLKTLHRGGSSTSSFLASKILNHVLPENEPCPFLYRSRGQLYKNYAAASYRHINAQTYFHKNKILRTVSRHRVQISLYSLCVLPAKVYTCLLSLIYNPHEPKMKSMFIL